MEQNKINNLLGFTGAFLIIIGVFCPVINMPFEGSVSFINRWIGTGIIVIIIGFLSAILAFFGKAKYLWLPAFILCAIMLLRLYDLKQKLDQYSLGSSFLKKNIQSLVSLEWGWFMLFGAIAIFLLSSFLSHKTVKS